MDNKDETKTPARRRYEAPRIEESGAFERLVLACGHTPGSGVPACTPRRGTPSS